jgi:hypothetical protein
MEVIVANSDNSIISAFFVVCVSMIDNFRALNSWPKMQI